MSTPASYATSYKSLIKSARLQLRAARGTGATYMTDAFWTDEELFEIAKRGTTDLWAAYIDLHQEHFLSINETDVSLPSGSTQLSGVPIDTFRVYLIEPLDPTTTQCVFIPRPYNHPDFIAARAWGAQTLVSPITSLRIYYCMSGAGTPNSTPVVLTAPKLASGVTVRFSYVPILSIHAYSLETSRNPIPGESDLALIAWICAYMRTKERDDRSPDPAWLTVYATEKQSLLTRSTPRQEQDVEVVDSVFGDYC